MKRMAIALLLGCVLVASGAVSQAAELYGLTGRGGSPKATLHILSQTDASVTPVLALSEAQDISSSSDKRPGFRGDEAERVKIPSDWLAEFDAAARF